MKVPKLGEAGDSRHMQPALCAHRQSSLVPGTHPDSIMLESRQPGFRDRAVHPGKGSTRCAQLGRRGNRLRARRPSVVRTAGTRGWCSWSRLAPGGRLSRVLTFTFAGSKIAEIEIVADPERLQQFELGVLE